MLFDKEGNKIMKRSLVNYMQDQSITTVVRFCTVTVAKTLTPEKDGAVRSRI